MDQWNGILRVPLSSNTKVLYRVAASLCVSPSTGSLAENIGSTVSTKPFIRNVLEESHWHDFYEISNRLHICIGGDRVEGTGNPVIERLSDLQRIADILVSKFGSSVNAWVIEAATFNGPFAVYKDFIPMVNEYGEPKSYDATEFPASASTVLLLKSCLKEAKSVISKKVKEPFQSHASSLPSFRMRTILLGFSKGGVILNQLITELSYSEVLSKQDVVEASKELSDEPATDVENQIIPTSKEILLNSITEIHYVDVGLNSTGAYLNDRDAIQRISQHVKQGESEFRFLFHGTPRQWCDGRRIWIRKEKDQLIHFLEEAAQENLGRLAVHESIFCRYTSKSTNAFRNH